VEYKDTKNEIRYIMYKWKTRDYDESMAHYSDDIIDIHINDSAHYETKDYLEPPPDHNMYYRSFMNPQSTLKDAALKKERERNRLQLLLNKKDTLKQRISDQYKKYDGIERVFSDEIQHAERVSYFFSWASFSKRRNVEQILRDFMAKYEG
jgi:hypothetical protein